MSVGAFSENAQQNTRYILDPKYPTLYVTAREKRILFHLLEGKTFFEIAEKINLVHQTVQYFVVQMQKRFDCQNVEALLAHPVIVRYVAEEKNK